MTGSENPVVLCLDIFIENYIPSNILARTSHIREVQFCISPALKGKRPFHAWIYGKPGTGKTMIARYILDKLKEESRVGGIYINCWKANSFYAVLDTLLDELRLGFGDERDTRVKLYKFEKFVRDKPFIVVLDEIDLMPVRERNSMIYNLLGIGNVGLICISGSRYPIFGMEDRIKSRLSPRFVHFEPYTEKELVEILKERVLIALHPKSWNEGILRKVAALAKGDARIAIQTLKNAAQHAEEGMSKAIEKEHIDKAFSTIKDLKKIYTLKKLSEDQRLLYGMIKNKGTVLSGQLWEAYQKECKKRKMKPVARRTFSHYTGKLVRLKLIKAERARVRGKVFSFRIFN